jgi:ubiquinone/menaquinone biosynthesis C-methylase UbiE
MADQDPDRLSEVAALFDRLAAGYDQTGVPYYAVIARGLVDRLHVQPGEHVLDVGAGRGAATFPLAEAVGEGGYVDAIDVAPGMVEHLAADTAGLPQVRVALGDAADPHPPGAPYDVVAASLVVFFLPDPLDALVRWRALLRHGGRLGVATFRPWMGAWRELDALTQEFTVHRSAIAPQQSAFDGDAGVERLLTEAGYGEVRTDPAIHRIPFADVDEWERWSRAGTVMGGLWSGTDEADHPEIRRRATEILEGTRGADGRIALEVGARYTFGVA